MSFAEALKQKHESYTPARQIVVDGHTVAWVRYEFAGLDGTTVSGHTVVCACDVDHEIDITSNECAHVEAALLLVALEARWALEQEFKDGDFALRLRGNMTYAFDPDRFERMVLRLMQWALDDQRWIGQRESAVLYNQSIGTVLDAPDQVMAKVCREMFAQKKIGLTGAIVSWWSQTDEPHDDDDSHLDDTQPPAGRPLSGKLFFFSETGTEGGLWAFQRDGHEGYEGLHVLATGDYLTAGSFSGYVRLRHFNSFTEDARGMWIHSDQRGLPREQWAEMFFAHLPATLIPGEHAAPTEC